MSVLQFTSARNYDDRRIIHTAFGTHGRRYEIMGDLFGQSLYIDTPRMPRYRAATETSNPDAVRDLMDKAQRLENEVTFPAIERVVDNATYQRLITAREGADVLVGIDAQVDAAREFVTSHPASQVAALITHEQGLCDDCAADGNHMQATAHAAYAALLRAITEEN